MLPEKIEEESFRIIDSLTRGHDFNEREWNVVRRVIHATCDFDFIKTIRFHPHSIEKGIDAIKRGSCIFFDTQMALCGISKKWINKFGNKTICHIADEDIHIKAMEMGITRASASVLKAREIANNGIFVIGNAPTALFTLLNLIGEKDLAPALIIGVPVGFVGARESKDELIKISTIPFITSVGNKGGTPVAVAILNSLFIMANETY